MSNILNIYSFLIHAFNNQFKFATILFSYRNVDGVCILSKTVLKYIWKKKHTHTQSGKKSRNTSGRQLIFLWLFVKKIIYQKRQTKKKNLKKTILKNVAAIWKKVRMEKT